MSAHRDGPHLDPLPNLLDHPHTVILLTMHMLREANWPISPGVAIGIADRLLPALEEAGYPLTDLYTGAITLAMQPEVDDDG